MKLSGPPAFLRIPPFPGAKVSELMRPAGAREVQQADLDGVIAALKHHRVGGCYWGKQPPLPPRYTLHRLAAPAADENLGVGNGNYPVVLWCEHPSAAATARYDQLITAPCDPWHMVAGANKVVVDADDEVALVAALCGIPVECIGKGRYEELATGTGGLRRTVVKSVLQSDFRDPFDGGSISAGEAVALSGFWRELIDSNRPIRAALGCAPWKRSTIAPLLWSGSELRFSSRGGMAPGSEVAIWRSRVAPAALGQIEASDCRLLEIEDGFIRSSGLGADCIPPLSIILDRSGIYFDPGTKSDLEGLLQSGSFPRDMVERARTLREVIVAQGVTKYATGQGNVVRRSGPRRQLLVTGQVEDDRAVLSGLGPATNLELLQRVRADAPGAYIIYKPHPDVEAGHRRGKIDDRVCLGLADEIVRDVSIGALIAAVDEIHVNTSLAGFEALLRDKPVVTYGVPFYAGWGLTQDKGPVPSRRSARRVLDELVAAALLVYPRYLDPLTGLPCPPEVLVSRLSQSPLESPGLLVRLRRLQGALRRRLPHRQR